MAIVAEFTIPCRAVPCGTLLKRDPDVRIEIERVVPADDSAMPFFWVYGCDPSEFAARAEREPELENLRLLTEVNDAALFEAEWTPHAEVVHAIELLDATIMDAVGDADGWFFQLRADGRDQLAAFQCIFSDRGISIELERIYEFSERAEPSRPLTADQRETLVTAYEAGYFDTPRKATQRDLAERFDVSPRAVSARLRRGVGNLVATALLAPNGTAKRANGAARRENGAAKRTSDSTRETTDAGTRTNDSTKRTAGAETPTEAEPND